MSGVNKVILVGRLGKDPEIKTFDSGNKVCNFSVATSEKFKDKSGEIKELTEWHNIVIWGKLVDIAERYIKKGDMVYLEGKLKTESYESDGITKYVTKINVFSMTMLGGNQGASSTPGPTTGQAPIMGQTPRDIPEGPVEDLPF